jgi:hypothetical protein
MQRITKAIITAALLAVPIAHTRPAQADPTQARPVVVELYTSQACSDCPPAEALMARLQAANPDIIVLAEHVAYFNGPRWADQFALPQTTARQKWYAGIDHAPDIYTPQAIIDGRTAAIGSDRSAITAAIAAASPRAGHPTAQVTITPDTAGWTVSITGPAPPKTASITLFRYDATDRTAIHGGENRGVDLEQIHVVRTITTLGAWTGQALTTHIAPTAAQHVAVLIQSNDGTILGAAAQ